MAGGDLGRRIIVAAVGIPIAVGILILGGWPLTLTMAGLAAVGTLELYRMGEARGWQAFPWIGLPATVAIVALAGWSAGAGEWALPAIAVLLSVVLLALGGGVFLRGPSGAPLPTVAITIFGVVYLAIPFAFALFLHDLSIHLLVLPFLATWLGDSAAYFAGRRFGKRKLLPTVSPAKTVEGGVGGVVGSMVGAAVYAAVTLGTESSPHHLPWEWALLLGAILGGSGIVGDLAESLLKREAGVKDSGTILPGHGGVLDRFDALLVNLPLTYLFIHFLLR